ncbi:hypothetical protein JCM5353_006408 [Sporobolomyces roseus]
MFNLLPPELVRQIIESSAPSTYHYETYADRQATLCQFCLVCKLFREIAQPLLFDFVWIDEQWKLDALHETLAKEGWRHTTRQLIFGEGECEQYWDADYPQKILRSCQGLRSLTLQLLYGGSMDLSVLQDLPHLVDLSLSRGRYQFPSCFRLHAVSALSIDCTTMQFAPTLLNPEALPSLRSLALIRIYDENGIAYLKRSRLDDLLPQLESLFLDSLIIQRGLDYLIPALSRTLFEFCPPSSDDRIDLLQVAQHLRIPSEFQYKDVIQRFVLSIANQDRQISLRSLYLDISLEDISSHPVDLVEAVEDVLRLCREKRIEVIYEDQEVGIAYGLRPSEEFRRRQREIRKLGATSE